MSEQVSNELIKVMNEITDLENTSFKIDASIFVRENDKLIKDKVAYLYNMIKVEARNCNQREELYFDDVNLIISHYQQLLNMVYDELYCQYTAIVNELQEASQNRRIAMINYQKLINQAESGTLTTSLKSKKEDLKNKNKTYKKIIDMCNQEIKNSRENFEKIINEKFAINSKSLQVISEQNIIQKFFGKIASIWNGKKKYTNILKDYNKTINDIDTREIINQMREHTVNFVADILELRGISENELEENARLGG